VLRREILARKATIGVVGQGYVGLSLACAAADAGFPVVGFDVDADRIAELSSGRSSVPGVSEPWFRSALEGSELMFTDDPETLRRCEILVICVPTPIRDTIPDLSHIGDACHTVAERLVAGRMVIVESTTYPGTTEQYVRPILESSGLVAGRDFAMAYSPERIDPGNADYGFREIPRIVGGLTPEAAGLAALFYEQLVDKVVVVSSCRAAELAKLLENAYRHVNIALVNELAMICHETEVDVWEVLDAAASKPFGFMAFKPGPGVGGHCIPVDSTYLAWQVRRDAGQQFRILEQAEDVNTQMPRWVAARIGEALNEAGKPVRGASILVLGVTYKADVADVRESPALKVMTNLYRRGAEVSFHDPYVAEVPMNGTVLSRVELTHRVMARADCVALLAPHGAYDLDWIAERAELVFDAHNAFPEDARRNVVRL
jgi:UDP-N-acetyl-D-glucosamine dehydrogenase